MEAQPIQQPWHDHPCAVCDYDYPRGELRSVIETFPELYPLNADDGYDGYDMETDALVCGHCLTDCVKGAGGIANFRTLARKVRV